MEGVLMKKETLRKLDYKTIKHIAQICHEAHRAYCNSLGDYSQPRWGAAKQWQKNSSMLMVDFILDYPDAEPKDIHDAWYAQKEVHGWTYGPVRDDDAMVHPFLVPYEQLPEEHKFKDHLLRAIVKAYIG